MVILEIDKYPDNYAFVKFHPKIVDHIETLSNSKLKRD